MKKIENGENLIENDEIWNENEKKELKIIKF